MDQRRGDARDTVGPMSAPPGLLRPSARPASLAGLLPDAPDVAVGGVSLDSRRIVPGDLYVALPGAATHGGRFAAGAVAAGAVAVLTDAEGARLCAGLSVPVVAVVDPRAAMGPLAAAVYGNPAGRVSMFGITGTNGKTSTLALLEAALAALGERVGTIGTIGFRLAGAELAMARTTVTTPESPDLQALLAVMVERGATAIAMEVSSHALALERVDGIGFDVAAFTNLGRDHLDFHPDLDDYFRAKSRLFLDGRSRTCVINIDDEAGRRLEALVRADGRARVLTCAVDRPADYRVLDATVDPQGRSEVTLQTPSERHTFTVGMLGEFNVRNALTAAAMIEAAGLPLGRALAGFATAAVPGRMQRVDLGEDAPVVVVDFAHTPEAVAASLAALPPGRRVAVLGGGGDRDPDKRGPMGAAAAHGADVVIVTDDNPRSEPPELIRGSVLAGARGVAARATTIVDGGDRRSAIRAALTLAGPGAWVAVLGKGHERGQDIGGVITPFDDTVVVAEEWAALNDKETPDA